MMSNTEQRTETDDKSSDYWEMTESNSAFEIDRSRVSLSDFLGAGQFGDVFRGSFRDKDDVVQDVAIKTCKLENEDEMAEKLLEEAGVMEQFDHKHIIRVYGVCSAPPVFIIMEYAALGEMRTFLKDNVDQLRMDQLILYCYQLSAALQYLESKQFVHRDIAARNVLVSSWSCVKLADFGLTRWLSENNCYTASKAARLPIKWMAPESINYRRFTTSSDVWMFGVCMWEILTYGEKPFTGISNDHVIEILESGIRLPLPSKESVSCPLSLYQVMLRCWQMDPEKRPRFAEVNERIREILAGEMKTRKVENVNIAKEGIKKPCDSHFGPADAKHPPPKPARRLCREHSRQMGGSIPELDSEFQTHRPLDFNRMPTANASLRVMWKSDIALDDLENGHQSKRDDGHRLHDKKSRDVNVDYGRGLPQNRGLPHLKRREGEEARKEGASEWERRLKDITLDRQGDHVYEATVETVKAVMLMTKTVDGDDKCNSSNGKSNRQQLSQIYQSMTMTIGVKLKILITSVEKVLGKLPNDSQNQVSMAISVLNSDMAELIRQTKLAQQYSNSLLDREYQKSMLKAGHVLAFDTRNLLDTVDVARKKQICLRTNQQS